MMIMIMMIAMIVIGGGDGGGGSDEEVGDCKVADGFVRGSDLSYEWQCFSILSSRVKSALH